MTTRELVLFLSLSMLATNAYAQGGDRNGVWNSRDQAAHRALNDASEAGRTYRTTHGRHAEHGGWIYRTNEGGYGYTSPYTSGDVDTVADAEVGYIANPPTADSGSDYVPRLHSGEEVVGFYHTHPTNHDEHTGHRYDGEHFSEPDLNFGENYNIPMYVRTPAAHNIKYEPNEDDPKTYDGSGPGMEDFRDDDEASYDHDSWSFFAYVTGEPHLRTHDGRVFSFQAAGEFIAESADDLTVMLRLEPYKALESVSVVTGVAVATGEHRFGFYATAPTLVIDGIAVDPEIIPGMALPDGASIRIARDRLTFRTKHGDRVVIRPRFGERLDTGFAVNARRKGKVQGLLGNFDGNPNNDFQARDGSPVDVGRGDTQQRRHSLYKEWGESWRITEEESIFDYLHGKSAAEYQVRDYPRNFISFADIEQDDGFEAAMTACREAGVTQASALRNCVFDLVVTGEPNFIESYRDDDSPHYETAMAAESGVVVNGIIEAPGEISRHKVQVREAGQLLFIVQEQFDKPLDLVAVGLFNRAGDAVASKCFGCGHIGLFSVDVPGTYYLQAGTPREKAVGEFAVRFWYVPDPDQFVVSTDTKIGPDRPGPGAGRIERPGSSDEYRLEVAAETTLAIKVAQFDREIDLLTWQLRDAAGNSVAQSCLGCSDKEGIFLQEAGEYVLRVGTTDREPGIGTYELSISSNTDQR